MKPLGLSRHRNGRLQGRFQLFGVGALLVVETGAELQGLRLHVAQQLLMAFPLLTQPVAEVVHVALHLRQGRARGRVVGQGAAREQVFFGLALGHLRVLRRSA